MGDRFPVDVGGGRVSAILYRAGADSRIGATLVLAHGAGGHQLTPFIATFAPALADRGLDTVTFNFSYMEQRRRIPDPRDRLEGCFRVVIDQARALPGLEANRLFAGGKSMGGRIATQIAAAPPALDLAGLVVLGYPLHPPGKPDQLRSTHLPRVTVPLLVVQGARDTFGTPDELGPFLAGLAHARLWVVDHGDHSFKVPKKAGVPQSTVYASIQDEMARWISGRVRAG